MPWPVPGWCRVNTPVSQSCKAHPGSPWPCLVPLATGKTGPHEDLPAPACQCLGPQRSGQNSIQLAAFNGSLSELPLGQVAGREECGSCMPPPLCTLSCVINRPHFLTEEPSSASRQRFLS